MKMMFRGLMAVGLAVCVQIVSAQASARSSDQDVVSVEVRGIGISRQAALNDALRKAVEQGGRLEIYARSDTENYVLIRDTVLSQVTGLIRDYKIVEEGEDALAGFFVRITARVDRRVIDATWGQVRILLQQMGRPRILVNIVESIHDVTLKQHEARVEPSSLLENQIEQLLVEKGFDLVDKNQIERLKRDQMEQAAMSQDVAAMRKLAGELGAEMFIVGFSRASGPQITDAYGVNLYMWETDITLKAFWSQTGQILFNRSLVGTRGGSRTPGPPGAKDAIAKSGAPLAWECLSAILEKWSREAVSGGKVVLQVKGLDFTQMLYLQDGLGQIDGIREIVRREWNKPIVVFELTTVHSADKMAEILSMARFPDFRLEIDNQRYSAIEASFIQTPKPTATRSALSE